MEVSINQLACQVTAGSRAVGISAAEYERYTFYIDT